MPPFWVRKDHEKMNNSFQTSQLGIAVWYFYFFFLFYYLTRTSQCSPPLLQSLKMGFTAGCATTSLRCRSLPYWLSRLKCLMGVAELLCSFSQFSWKLMQIFACTSHNSLSFCSGTGEAISGAGIFLSLSFSSSILVLVWTVRRLKGLHKSVTNSQRQTLTRPLNGTF